MPDKSAQKANCLVCCSTVYRVVRFPPVQDDKEDMTIYTKTGDKGTTSLFGGKRVAKSDLLVECYGTIDELNAFIGFAKITVKNKKLQDLLTMVQKDLYSVMAVLSGSTSTSLSNVKKNIIFFEKTIDSLTSKMPELTGFILPQNNEPSTRLHIVRTVCRRAERALSRYSEVKGQNGKMTLDEKKVHVILAKYLNRLSDLLFTMARFESDKEKIAKA